jgi:hypothetical protein
LTCSRKCRFNYSRTLTPLKDDIIEEERRYFERKNLHDEKFEEEKEQRTIKERR